MPKVYDPARMGLRFVDWPEADRAAWAVAIAEGDVLDGHGPAAHWAAATRKTNMVNYGRWLGYLRYTGELSLADQPANRIRPETVKAYARHLKPLVAPKTVLALLVGLKVTIMAMAPGEWRWLADLCNALNRSAEPSKDKAVHIRPSADIYNTALAELDRLQALPQNRRKWLCAYRDTLMIALLAARPLRSKNFTTLELGKTLLRNDAGWLIAIPGNEVKNGQPLEFDLTESLVPYLETYLKVVQPQILGPDQSSNRLWVAWHKPALTSREVYDRIVAVTGRLLGTPISPHLFRDCAATSLSLVSTGAARAAAPLLGHRHFTTTERHYVRARQLEASRSLNDVLSSIQSSPKSHRE